ncbi:MAG: XisH family protein [Chroococcidiopsidaceae cyanobacterium CP_BM_ER_R8_30]|nr:XisH family protein [Chroococcidiopsidaceae cyanobacterium CP_BM_ER_R8_30]
MPARDIYHNAVKAALIKDGWVITADPYFIKYENAALYADLAAEKPIAATRGSEKIVVEVKSFVGRSLMHDFQQALGQYLIYRRLIELTEPEYQVYLAIDDVTYQDFFSGKAIQVVVQANQLLIIVVDIEREEIVQWTS